MTGKNCSKWKLITSCPFKVKMYRDCTFHGIYNYSLNPKTYQSITNGRC